MDLIVRIGPYVPIIIEKVLYYKTLIGAKKWKTLAISLITLLAAKIPNIQLFIQESRYPCTRIDPVLSISEKNFDEVLYVKVCQTNKNIYFSNVTKYNEYLDEAIYNSQSGSKEWDRIIYFKSAIWYRTMSINKIIYSDQDYLNILSNNIPILANNTINILSKNSKTPVILNKIINSDLYSCYDGIIKSIKEYNDNKIKLSRLGNNKISYLFYGPSGCGKSILAKHLALLYDVKTIYIPFIDKGNILGLGYSKCVVLFDEADLLFSYDNEKDKDNENKVGLFDQLIKYMDDDRHDETVIVFTTNNPERFDPRLFRPGRIDYQIEFGKLSFPQICNFVKSQYGSIDISLLAENTLLSAKLIELIKQNITSYPNFVQAYQSSIL